MYIRSLKGDVELEEHKNHLSQLNQMIDKSLFSCIMQSDTELFVCRNLLHVILDYSHVCRLGTQDLSINYLYNADMIYKSKTIQTSNLDTLLAFWSPWVKDNKIKRKGRCVRRTIGRFGVHKRNRVAWGFALIIFSLAIYVSSKFPSESNR